MLDNLPRVKQNISNRAGMVIFFLCIALVTVANCQLYCSSAFLCFPHFTPEGIQRILMSHFNVGYQKSKKCLQIFQDEKRAKYY